MMSESGPRSGPPRSTASKLPNFNMPPQERAQLGGLGPFFIGNWGTAGEKKCISPSHLWMSHDQSTLQIDVSLSNTGLLAVKKTRATNGRVPGMESRDWDGG